MLDGYGYSSNLYMLQLYYLSKVKIYPVKRFLCLFNRGRPPFSFLTHKAELHILNAQKRNSFQRIRVLPEMRNFGQGQGMRRF